MDQAKITPMIKQYLTIKEEYPDAILFYRMGDFYEMFFDDSKTASKVLEITLTSRNKNDYSPVPMCGVPFRAARGYIARLIENGYKVAICDQTEDPALARGLVKREVIRVITPGMIIEDEFLDEKTNNFILALFSLNNSFGISYVDISTGTFRLAQSSDVAAVSDEILRISPKEILIPASAADNGLYAEIINGFPEKAISYINDEVFEFNKSRERLIGQFNTFSLEGFGCENLKSGISAAGALIYYISENQKQRLSHLTGLDTYYLDNFLWIDETSCRNLELMKNLQTGSRHATLLSVLDKTITSMGSRLFKE